MYWLQSIVQALNNMGFYGFVLPWLFTFAVVYAILYKANLFGEINKQVSGLLAIVIAFFVTGLGGPYLSQFFVTLFGGASVWIAGILVILIFFGLVGLPTTVEKAKGIYKWLIGLVLLVIAIAIFLPATGVYLYGLNLSPDAIAGLFVVIVIALAVYFVLTAGGEKGGAPEAPEKGGEKPTT